MPLPGTGWPWFGAAGDLPPEWWQCSMLAMGCDWLRSDKFSRIKVVRIEEALLEPEFASAGSVQPMKQARAAIHREMIVAVATLNA
jgi:hypothetical protein